MNILKFTNENDNNLYINFDKVEAFDSEYDKTYLYTDNNFFVVKESIDQIFDMLNHRIYDR